MCLRRVVHKASLYRYRQRHRRPSDRAVSAPFAVYSVVSSYPIGLAWIDLVGVCLCVCVCAPCVLVWTSSTCAGRREEIIPPLWLLATGDNVRSCEEAGIVVRR